MRLTGGPSYHRLRPLVYLAYGSTAKFRFRGPIAKIYISKEREGYGVRSGPKILEIDPVSYRDFPWCKVNANGL